MMAQMKLDSDSEDEDDDDVEDRQGEKLSPSEERAREAEKRAAWRKARYSSPMSTHTLLCGTVALCLYILYFETVVFVDGVFLK